MLFTNPFHSGIFTCAHACMFLAVVRSANMAGDVKEKKKKKRRKEEFRSSRSERKRNERNEEEDIISQMKYMLRRWQPLVVNYEAV